MIIENGDWVTRALGIVLGGDALAGGTGVLTPDGIRAIEGALARVKTEPGYAERNQPWLDELARRHKEGTPAQRQAMLRAAQRAENMRDTVIGRLTE